MNRLLSIFALLLASVVSLNAAEVTELAPDLSDATLKSLGGKQILYIERNDYPTDHHNTGTMFLKGEFNANSYAVFAKGGSALRIFDVDTKEIKSLVELGDGGLVRDPEISFDGTKVVFSMRKNFDDEYHIYEINVDGTGLTQLTFAKDIADIDPLYLPDGGIVFSSTRQPKYCMCNRHIMCNLFRMNGDGSNITQIGVSTLFEGHSALLPDGRIIYDRWEYVDRNFSNAQALWTVNPDGTKHSIYYGNNTNETDGIIDPRAIPGTDLVACIFGNCHEAPLGALAIIDRKKGIDGLEPIVHIWPEDAMKLMTQLPKNKSAESSDRLRNLSTVYEDPYPLSAERILVARIIDKKLIKARARGKSAIYLVGTDGLEEMILQSDNTKGLYDPMIVELRFKPTVIPSQRNFEATKGQFYVQDVYIGTHMEGVEKGSVKYLRLVESMEKRTFTMKGWGGQGLQAPGVNWHNFDIKRIVGEFEVEEDGSVFIDAPAGKHLYFQLLDEDKKMIQTMRSGVSLMPGEVNGCVGCHEDRLDAPVPSPNIMAIKKPAQKINGWRGEVDTDVFGYMDHVQPILDRHCVKCHDFDKNDRDKLVLAGDLNMYFNASYINLYMSKTVELIGGGPAVLQAPYSWGSHNSKLVEIIENRHKRVKLSDKEKETIYTWLDLNGGYYPMYESSFDNVYGGRSPLTLGEADELKKLTGLDIRNQQGMSSCRRTEMAQISFDRPEESPCLDIVRDDKAKYDRVVELIKIGAERLQETPRGDWVDKIVYCERNKEQLKRYVERMEGENQNTWIIDTSVKRFDEK
ncbi:MAG: hypothetical protein R3Y68_03795 [Rikenellaceae bacterium]